MFKMISYQYKPNKDLIMAIDLGINNLLTCVVSNNESFIIDGKYLKSINHFYNKKKHIYNQESQTIKNIQKWSLK